MSSSYLLRDDGKVIAFGMLFRKTCIIGESMPGVTFKQVSAGCKHIVLLRTDGRVIARGFYEKWDYE